MLNECSVNISLLNQILSDSLVVASGGKAETMKSFSCKLNECDVINIDTGLLLGFEGNNLKSVEFCTSILDNIKRLQKENSCLDIGIRVIYDIKYEDNQKLILSFIKDYMKIALNIK